MSEVSEDLIITKHSDLYTGAEFLCNALAQSGVTHVYGGHGGAVVPLIDSIVAHPSLTWVYCRCEVNASQMAAAHAKLHGTLGCCIATSGPGAAHLLSGLVDADQDRVPLLCITGMKSSDHVRYADFQDIDQASIFRMAGLAFSETVADVGQLLPLTRNAFTLAISSNRCAHLAIPVNIQQEVITARTHFCLGTTYQLLQSVPATKVQLDALVMALRTEIVANRNVLIACGYRANLNGLGRHIERLAELLHSPILTSYDGKGTVDENHPLSFGVVGVYGNAGTYSALDLLEQCDTVIGICVNDWTELATDSSGLQVRRIIQIDDRLVAGDSFRFAPSAVLSCGYLGESLGQVNKALEEYMRPLTRYSHRVTGTVDIDLDAIVTHEPKTQKHTWEELKKESYTKPVGTPSTFLQMERLIDSSEVTSKVHCHPAVFFDVMARYLSSSSTICADIGDNALFMAASLAAQRGQRFLTSEHLGIMGYSINSAIAASVSTGGEEKTLAVAGDGAIQMSINELATMRDHRAKNVLVVVVVNSRLGRVQNEIWGPTLKADGCGIGSPDYVKLFEAYGYPGGQVLSTCDNEVISNTIEKGWELAAKHGCSVIVINQDPQVHPIMHKLKALESLHEKPFATNESVLPSIKTHHWQDSKTQIKEWLGSMSETEVSDSHWLNKGDLFSTSVASVVERLFKSLSINAKNATPLKLFTSAEARSTFDADFRAAFLNAMPPKAIVELLLNLFDTSLNRPNSYPRLPDLGVLNNAPMKLIKSYSLLLLSERATSFRLLSLSSSSSHGRRYYSSHECSFRRTAIDPHSTSQPLLNILHAKKSFDYSSDIPYEILPLQEVVENLTARTTGASTTITVDDHLKAGLSNEDATKILEEVGPNALEPPAKKSIWELWLQQFDDGLVKILVGVAIASAAFSISEVWDIIKENNNLPDELRSTVLQSLVEPSIIIAILLLNAVVGVWQDLSARSSLESLEKMQPRLATVLRHHSDTTTNNTTSSSSEWIIDYDATKLVPGDVIKLKVGGIVPADARLGLLTSATMYVDESSLTGESVSVGKLSGDEGLVDIIQNSNPDNGEEGRNEKLSIPIQLQTMMLFSGSLITRGSGVGVIVRTGSKTQMGMIQSTLAEAQIEGEERKTPLGVQLDEFGRKLSYIIGGICLAVWVASIPRFSDSAFNSWLEGSIYYAKVGVALGVAAIPEGLPAVITLCLSLGTRKMAEKNVIVRKLPSVETLGCTSVICTDKTGTLTTNQMTAVSFILLEEESGGINVVEHNVNGSSYSPAGYVEGIDRDETLRLPNGAVSEACRIMCLCNDARLIGDDESYQYKIEGEPTEASLLALSEKLGPDAAANQPSGEEVGLKPSQLASLNCRHISRVWDRYATLEFDRKRKSMSVLCSRLDTDSEEDKLFVKGAPNLLLERCTHVKTRDGKTVLLTSHLRDEIDSTIDSIGNKALRCIGLALSTPPKTLHRKEGTYTEFLKDSSQYESIETGLTFVGMVAIRDPPRDGVAESIDQCKQAGIRVIMITGDAKQTAEAIARDVNILTDEDVASSSTRAFEGREFFALPESQQLETLRSGNLVICRAEPKDKQQLVKMLQSLQEIPAMTGDGVNDAPALQQASIGVAMGVSGTDVAKEASDMVLVDDNFSTIVDAVKQGRAIYANMQAFINFLITCNIGEVIGVFLATLLGFPQLLTPLHLLWVNLVTDGPPATALGFNPPDPGLMNRKPRSSSEEIMTSENLLRYSIAGTYIGVATVGVYASYFFDHGVSFEELRSWSTCTDSCSIYADLAAPQTLALSTLVTTELLKALCSVSIDSSILKVGPQKNPWLLLGVTVPFALNLAIIYTPALEQSFGLVPLSSDDWLKVLAWSFPIVLIDEVLKFAFKKDLTEHL